MALLFCGQPKKQDRGLLARFDNYHITRKNARFEIIILHRHPWGGRFPMRVRGERRITGGKGRIFKVETY